MRVISWDVGIKNLAYCVLEYEPNEEPVIIDWDLINLGKEEEYHNIVCSGCLANGNHCQKTATYYLITPDGDCTGYCSLHKSQSNEIWSAVDTENLFKKTNSGGNCDYVGNNKKKCCKDSKYSYNDDSEYYCSLHYRSVLAKKIKQFSVTEIKNKSLQKQPTFDIQVRLIDKMNELLEHFVMMNITEVVIENQPSLKNPKMKAIASTLFDYFLIRGYMSHDNGLKIKHLRFFSPSNKLKVDKDNTLFVFKKSSKKEKYKLTKQLSIKYTNQLLESHPDQLEYLSLFKKKDDLCDAYLQGRYYLEYVRK